MALKVDGRYKVKRLKDEFFQEFGVNIRVYKGSRFADDNVSLASIRADNAPKADDFEIHGNTNVGNVEKAFLEKLGIKVQVENAEGELADNSVSLSSLRK